MNKAWIIAFAVLGMLVVSSLAWANEEHVRVHVNSTAWHHSQPAPFSEQ
jgi:hypothetical protein